MLIGGDRNVVLKELYGNYFRLIETDRFMMLTTEMLIDHI